MNRDKKRIAIFASGGGSNAEAIMQKFKDHARAEVVLVCTNKPTAGVLDRAKRFDIESVILPRSSYSESQALIDLMERHSIDLVVLAGYLKLIPAAFTGHFHKRILNIHPGLLPTYGGKGMYGMHVHEAVITDKAPYSGITIHFVDEQYDHGSTILEHAIPVHENWSAKELARTILSIEHSWYPEIVEMVVKQL